MSHLFIRCNYDSGQQEPLERYQIVVSLHSASSDPKGGQYVQCADVARSISSRKILTALVELTGPGCAHSCAFSSAPMTGIRQSTPLVDKEEKRMWKNVPGESFSSLMFIFCYYFPLGLCVPKNEIKNGPDSINGTLHDWARAHARRARSLISTTCRRCIGFKFSRNELSRVEAS